jgi:methionyl aminopeptidase
VNEVICHGIPDDRALLNGDIVNLDISTYKYGFHADLNETFAVGEIPESSKFLIEKTYNALEMAISICKPGVMYREVGNVIGKYVEEHGLAVTRTYTGHGVGKLFHCAPNVPHYKNNKATGSIN